MARPPFTDAIRSIVKGLQEGPRSQSHLNVAASRIDHLGRRLHGLGYLRDREIASSFKAAVQSLLDSQSLSEEMRAAAAMNAASHLEIALANAAEGTNWLQS